MTARLSRQREAEIDGRAAHVYEYSTSHSAEWDELAREDVPALLAELAAARAERDEARVEAERRKTQVALLLKQIQKKDARSGEADAVIRQFLSDDEGVSVPRTERSHWIAIADALNAAEAAGMPVGIDLDGTLTDNRAWSVIWDREAKKWAVAGYDDDGAAS
ncbi:hypothetical protein ABZY36_35625 [Streptomyces sp. NPDC006627]|uniref:hypothetical protein n=1 Tax=Streptomyces sp. NPDC006627 TaxID=3154679 RepID=UPI0033AC30B6